ncbi:MAG: DUF1501 domain-containing protein [Actinomycetota bacterium]
MSISRRKFIGGVGATGALAAGGYSVFAWSRAGTDLAAKAKPVPTTTSSSAATAEIDFGLADRTLVILELSGGNDALSMVVPHGDGRYYDLRPTLAVIDAIDLDGAIGLAPALTTLAGEYRAGRLAIVEGVGDPDLSHFESQHRWWTGNPVDNTATGWLGRYLDATVGYDDPLAGITIGVGPSPALAGVASFSTAIADDTGLQPGRLDIDGRDALFAAWKHMAASPLTDGLLGDVQRAIGETIEARARLSATLGDARGEPRRRALSIADALVLAARLLSADPAPRTVYVQAVGDFDTHQAQPARHATLMRQLDDGIAAFLTALDEAGVADRVVLATASEFGRRARENGNGTDHGTAAAHLVLGTGVRGGRYGESPSLLTLDDTDNLVPTVPLHTYYASLLGWLGVDAEPMLGRPAEPLALFT